mmetsp:Transcript_686/g.1864  ORF Transcript_686/g.1864 Transcript_686/m.1864 type:complete len:180 (-) Transcript_686:981-1520(-)
MLYRTVFLASVCVIATAAATPELAETATATAPTRTDRRLILANSQVGALERRFGILAGQTGTPHFGIIGTNGVPSTQGASGKGGIKTSNGVQSESGQDGTTGTNDVQPAPAASGQDGAEKENEAIWNMHHLPVSSPDTLLTATLRIRGKACRAHASFARACLSLSRNPTLTSMAGATVP